MSDVKANVEDLVRKAGKAANAVEAMNFSQAACNAANALRALADVPPGKTAK